MPLPGGALLISCVLYVSAAPGVGYTRRLGSTFRSLWLTPNQVGSLQKHPEARLFCVQTNSTRCKAAEPGLAVPCQSDLFVSVACLHPGSGAGFETPYFCDNTVRLPSCRSTSRFIPHIPHRNIPSCNLSFLSVQF